MEFVDYENPTLTILYSVQDALSQDITSATTFITKSVTGNKIHFEISPSSLAEVSINYKVVVVASDSRLASTPIVFDVYVTNHAPYFVTNPFPELIVVQGHVKSYQVDFTDDDSLYQSITLQSIELCNGNALMPFMNMVGNQLTLNPSLSATPGLYCVRFTITDGYEQAVQDLTVNLQLNTPPVFT